MFYCIFSLLQLCFSKVSLLSKQSNSQLEGTHTRFISNFSLCATVSAPRWQSVAYAWVLFIFPPRPNRDDSLVLMSTSLMQSRIKWIPLGAGVVQAHSEWLGCRFVSLGFHKFFISSYLLSSHVDWGGGGEKIEVTLFSYCSKTNNGDVFVFLCFLMHGWFCKSKQIRCEVMPSLFHPPLPSPKTAPRNEYLFARAWIFTNCSYITHKLTVADAAAVRMAQRVGVVSFLHVTGHLLTFVFSQ